MTASALTFASRSVPARFDDYEVVGPLGAGGMGTVFAGHDRQLDRPVALKFITAPCPDHRARARFLEEARALARLHHPNVASIYRTGTVAGRPYLAYELVDGEPLHRVSRPMPWRRALRIGVGIARGLAAVHASGVLHRDIKPANIVLAAGDQPKLIDFGLACRTDASAGGAVDARALARAIDTAAPTQDSHEVAGTPAYMAPELWEGAPASAASDVYAVGLVLWELLAGELPHAGLDGDALVTAIRTQRIPSIAGLRPELPAALVELVDQCVARGARPTADALRARLEAIEARAVPRVDARGDDAAPAGAIEQALLRALAEVHDATSAADLEALWTRTYQQLVEHVGPRPERSAQGSSPEPAAALTRRARRTTRR